VNLFDLAEVDRLLTTTRAVRKRLDLTRPVEPEMIVECIRLATHAPNASNQQEWRWVVVTDATTRQAIAAEYQRILLPISADLRAARERAGDVQGLRLGASVTYLAEHLAEVPVLVVPCFRYEVTAASDLAWVARMFASVYPAVWSFQLALRSRGLGSTLTTAHLVDPGGVAEVLGIPEGWTQTALVPVAHTIGTDFGPARRGPVEAVIGWERF
jgi:nitroreductase